MTCWITSGLLFAGWRTTEALPGGYLFPCSHEINWLVPLFPKNRKFVFLCSLFPNIGFFNCSPQNLAFVPLFPWNKCPVSPVPQNPWKGLTTVFSIGTYIWFRTVLSCRKTSLALDNGKPIHWQMKFNVAKCHYESDSTSASVLVQPRKTRLYITERLLMGRKE